MTEIEKLVEWLKTSKYGYKEIKFPGQHKIEIYADKNCILYVADVVCNPISMGYNTGKLEGKGGPFTTILSPVTGYMSAEDVIQKLENWNK